MTHVKCTTCLYVQTYFPVESMVNSTLKPTKAHRNYNVVKMSYISIKLVENKTTEQPNNTENQETLICNFIYFGSWHLKKKGFMGGFCGDSGKFQKLYKADDPGSLICFISL